MGMSMVKKWRKKIYSRVAVRRREAKRKSPPTSLVTMISPSSSRKTQKERNIRSQRPKGLSMISKQRNIGL